MQDLKLAVLIDADNISPKYVKVILDEAASFGVAACKRIYGDWSDARLKSWKDVLLNNSIIPIQQYSYTTGKNATDSAMIIDAMDLLYSGNLDGFCIVSSDSDFTRLAARLREGGKLVIALHIKVGFGLNISTITQSITHRVKDEVEQATGLKVARVVVSVDDVIA